MLPSLRGQLTPREGAGQLPVLLLEWGQLPCSSSHSQALRCRDKGKPAVKRGRKAYGPALKQRAGSRATERRWGLITSPY
jgi:hypothetical protein